MRPSRRRPFPLLLPVALLLLLAACFTSYGRWSYPSGHYPTTASARGAAAFVLVQPLLDLRGATNVSSMAWFYVPLVPIGWSYFDRPEGTVPGEMTTNYQGDPCADLPRAIAIELQRQRLVARAEFAANFETGRGETHVLRGRLRSFFVGESRYSYGLSVYGQLLWGLGLPMGMSSNGICVELELVEVQSGKTVWHGDIFDSDYFVEGLYYGPQWYRFAAMWERRLREKMGELARALGAEPAPLPEQLVRDLAELPAPVRPPDRGS